MPPFGVLPALAVSLTVAVWLIDGAARAGARPRPRRSSSAAIAGWWLGFGYFVAGLWWLGAAFLVEADLFAWAMPLGVLGLPAVLALFPAPRLRPRARSSGRRAPARLFAFAVGADRQPNGCAATSSPAFPGTRSAWRSGRHLC